MSAILSRKLPVLFFSAIIIMAVKAVDAQKLPLGYIVQYSNKCNNENFFKDLVTENPGCWKILHEKYLQGTWVNCPDSLSGSYEDISKGVISPYIYGDYILEFEFRFYKTISDSALFSFLGPVKTPDTYYAFCFSRDTVTFYFMKQGQQAAIKKLACPYITGQWNKIRVERNILKRRTTIIVNGNTGHKLTFTDKNLVMGYLGFGSNSSCLIRDIVVYAPTSITDTPFKWF